jgi:hypothetical protein
MPHTINPQWPECEGQLELICRSCEGQRIILSDDTEPEPCDDCDATGIDPESYS